MTDTSSEIIKPSDDFDYYVGDIYWNNFEAVNAWTNRKVSGEAHDNWRRQVAKRYGSVDTALFIQCGNGWVERDFFRESLIKEVIGTDISPQMLEEAEREAAAIGMPARYIPMDTNTGDLDQFTVDWVVNHAALHHVAYIDRTVRQIAKLLLRTGGLFVAYDYTGPHRNQYPWKDWSEVLTLNASLPEKYRRDIQYPHMPTMLHMDPTEAIHSELILETVARYFDFEELTPIGGAVAYALLFQNKALHADQNTPEGAAAIQQILDTDDLITGEDPARSYFNFWVAKPKPNALDDAARLDAWSAEEAAREDRARTHGGRYGPVDAMELVFNRISDLEWKIAHG